jgi:hypothetical protein
MKGALNQAPKVLATYIIPEQQQPQEQKHKPPSPKHVSHLEQRAKQEPNILGTSGQHVS